MKTQKHLKVLKSTVTVLSLVVLFGLFLPLSIKHIAAKDIEPVAQYVPEKENSKSIYDPVLPDYTIKFGQDFAEHPTFQNEVWHYKANLKGEDGQEYGVQWTVYRIANSDTLGLGWKNAQVYTAQVVVSNSEHTWLQQRLSRGGIGQAGVMVYPFRLWIDDWTWVSNNNEAVPSYLNIKTDDFSLKLNNAAYGPFVLNGDNGYKKTHELISSASYSFSAPFIKTKGLLELNGRKVKVEGIAWVDKEWGNQLVTDNPLRWDSFSIHLSDGRVLSLTQYHNSQDKHEISGSITGRDGARVGLKNDDVRIYPLEKYRVSNGRDLPLRWVIEIPRLQVSLITESLNNELWLPFWIPSWEGAIVVTGSHKGVGFMQLFGY